MHHGELKFLNQSVQIETGYQQISLLYAQFDPALYSDTLFEGLHIAFPASLRSAVDKRKSDYLAGRALSNRAFQSLGLEPVNVPIGPKRGPVWPAGINGSISHTKGYCTSILSADPRVFVGVDIEGLLSENGLKSVHRIAFSDTERSFATTQTAFTQQYLGSLVFSAKETLYKCLFPIVQAFFGFDAAEVYQSIGTEIVRLRLTRTLHATLIEGQVFEIHHQVLDDKILTWMTYMHPTN